MAMVDDLARREGRRHEFGAVHNRIETALEKPDHLLAGVAVLRELPCNSRELPLGDIAVIALQLLLGVKLRAIVGKLCATSSDRADRA